MRLDDKVCIITGGAAGIGKATAACFAKQNAQVIICDVDRTAGEQVASDIGGEFFLVDVGDR